MVGEGWRDGEKKIMGGRMVKGIDDGMNKWVGMWKEEWGWMGMKR